MLMGEKLQIDRGTDAFYFTTANSKGTLMPYGWEPNVTIDDIKNDNAKDFRNVVIHCNMGDRTACTLWLYLNDWKMDKDYQY